MLRYALKAITSGTSYEQFDDTEAIIAKNAPNFYALVEHI
jgi:hypothetical protein